MVTRDTARRPGPSRRDRQRVSAALVASLHKMAERFRHAREEAGLTLRQLADRAHLSASTVQKVETGKIIPTVAVMVRLADALNRRASYFIEDGDHAMTDIRLVRRRQGRRLGRPGARVTFEHIAEPLLNPRMEAFRVTVAPGGFSGDEAQIIYRGEEIVICTEGTVEFQMRGQTYRIEPGDTFHFKGDIPHTWNNPGQDDAEMIMVCAFVQP